MNTVIPGHLNSIEIEIHKGGKLYATVSAISKLKTKYNISTRNIHVDIGAEKVMDSNIGPVTLKYKK